MTIISNELRSALQNNDVVRVFATLDRRLLASDSEKKEYCAENFSNLNLLEYTLFPVIGTILAEGFVEEINKLIAFDAITTAELVS